MVTHSQLSCISPTSIITNFAVSVTAATTAEAEVRLSVAIVGSTLMDTSARMLTSVSHPHPSVGRTVCAPTIWEPTGATVNLGSEGTLLRFPVKMLTSVGLVCTGAIRKVFARITRVGIGVTARCWDISGMGRAVHVKQGSTLLGAGVST